MAYLTPQTGFGDIREKFVRLQQISTLLNLDSVGSIIQFRVLNSSPDYRMKTLMNSTMGPVYRGELVPMKLEQSRA